MTHIVVICFFVMFSEKKLSESLVASDLSLFSICFFVLFSSSVSLCENMWKILIYFPVFSLTSCPAVLQTQVALLTRYLWIGKYCYEMRNFATAMQVLGGLENVIVRQLPVRLQHYKLSASSNKSVARELNISFCCD